MILMPEIGTADDVAGYLNVSKRTVYNLTAQGLWCPGIYIGRGKYNIDRLKLCIETPPFRYSVEIRNQEFCSDLKP